MTEKIKLSHGAGGELMDNLIKDKILKYFDFKSNKIDFFFIRSYGRLYGTVNIERSNNVKHATSLYSIYYAIKKSYFCGKL